MKKNTVYIFFRNIFLMFVGFLISVVIARSLGPELQGTFTLLTLIPMLCLNLGNLGIGSSVVYLINKFPRQQRNYTIKSLHYIMILSIINTIVGSIGAYIYFERIHLEYTTIIFLIVIALIPSMFLSNILIYFFQATKEFKKYSFLSTSPKMLQLLILFITVLLGINDLYWTLLSLLISNIVVTIWCLIIIINDIKKLEINDDYINNKDILYYGLKTHLANTITFLNYRLDQILLGIFAGSYQVGIYNIGVIIIEKIWGLTTPLTVVLFPEMSSNMDEKIRISLTTKVCRIMMFFNVIIALGILIIIKPFIIISFGEEYVDSINIVLILLPGILLMAVDRILSNEFSSIGLPEINMKISFITLVINFLFALILIPLFGITGAAFSTTLAYVITFILKAQKYKKVNRILFKDILILNNEDIKFIRNIKNKLK